MSDRNLFLPLLLGATLLIAGCSNPSNLQPRTEQAPSAEMTNLPPLPPPLPQSATLPHVVVNGQTMTAQQLEEFRSRYGSYPGAGSWWYDSRSGLFGQQGGPAVSFMHAGQPFGPLDPNCSAGNTNVFINGRHLPLAEVYTWAQLIGTAVMPGRYWFDSQGNVGYEGYDVPLGNLYQLVQQRGNHGGQGGGDNGWNTRFSSGNYTSDGSAGYVSVPGVGVIGSYGVD